MTPLRIAALEPYAALSHLRFLEGLRDHSRHEIELFTLPPRAWKWRMRTASVAFARILAARAPFHRLLVSDYLNLPELIAALPPPHRDVPAIVYMHENQLTYPLQPGEARDHHFGLTHFHSMLAARRTLFNSRYHRAEFFAALEALFVHVPDVDLAPALATVRERAEVMPLATDVPAQSPRDAPDGVPVVLWNHRWEYDKDPAALAEAMGALVARGERFRLHLLGQGFRAEPPELAALRRALGERLGRVGFLPSRADYLAALAESHVVLSTARHEFFGLATLEALRTGCHGVLPHDLAYPELLPDDAQVRARFLYDRADGPVEALCSALATVRAGVARRARAAAVDFTDRFCWEVMAPRFDALLADPG